MDKTQWDWLIYINEEKINNQDSFILLGRNLAKGFTIYNFAKLFCKILFFSFIGIFHMKINIITQANLDQKIRLRN